MQEHLLSSRIEHLELIMQIDQALKIGGFEFVLKFLVYFAHERLWVQIGDNIN